MQMWTGSPPGCTDQADILTLVHGLPLAHRDLAHVRVDRGLVVVVLHQHDIAIAVLPSGEIDHAVADAAYRRA